jgi:hypothetical protein
LKDTNERRPVKGFEKFYETTRHGQIFSLRLNRFIKHRVGHYGPFVSFQIDNQQYTFTIGQAIYEAWATEEDRKIVRRITKETKGRSYPEIRDAVLADPDVKLSCMPPNAFLSAIMGEEKKPLSSAN